MIDKQTFEQIFRHHYDGMFRLARRMLGDDAESKDVVSDVFASLLGKDETELKTDTLQGFLLTSVRNRCVNLLVHKQKEQAAIVNLKDNADEDSGQERQGALPGCLLRLDNPAAGIQPIATVLFGGRRGQDSLCPGQFDRGPYNRLATVVAASAVGIEQYLHFFLYRIRKYQ